MYFRKPHVDRRPPIGIFNHKHYDDKTLEYDISLVEMWYLSVAFLLNLKCQLFDKYDITLVKKWYLSVVFLISIWSISLVWKIWQIWHLHGQDRESRTDFSHWTNCFAWSSSLWPRKKKEKAKGWKRKKKKEQKKEKEKGWQKKKEQKKKKENVRIGRHKLPFFFRFLAFNLGNYVFKQHFFMIRGEW